MKKSILLGAAAIAAVTFAGAAADAGEVKLGGYYQFRLTNFDNNVVDETVDGLAAGGGSAANGGDDANYWVHRFQLNMDMKASEKSHAHARIRVIDSGTVQGADTGTTTALIGNGNTTANMGANPVDWNIRQLWLETEAWGVGVKVGEMPVSLNDNILVNHDTTAFGTIMLSKSFGDVTVVGAAVKTAEDALGGPGAAGFSANGGVGMGADKDDIDLYVLSLLGKGMGVNYQATMAYLTAQSDSDLANAVSGNVTDKVSDWWVALTLSGAVSGIDLTGTLIYEAGMDNVPAWGDVLNAGGAAGMVQDQLQEGDFLVALRAKGKTGFGGWNGYAFYAGEDFTGISNTNAMFSETWDLGGPGAQDLMNRVFNGAGVAATGYNAGTAPIENVWGVGAGLTVNAGGWTIRPMIDYGHTVETDRDNSGVDDVNIKSAWGGSLILSTPIQQDTTLSLIAQYVDPSFTPAADGVLCTAGVKCEDSMHQLIADIKLNF